LLFVGIDLPISTAVGTRLRIHHGSGIVINCDAIIGDDVSLRHNTTIGNARSGGPSPRVWDRVSVGPHSIILGGIEIGSDAQVGAGSLVTADVPPRGVTRAQQATIRHGDGWSRE
jgi:serine acetyltransferase